MPGQHVAPAALERRKKIGKRLRLIRKKIAPGGTWRALEIAAWLGVGSETWREYERGKAAIPGDILLRLIVELGISPRWLLTGQGAIRTVGEKRAERSRDDEPSTA
jgi:transcriptional regulator with XRE-family HTH domain